MKYDIMNIPNGVSGDWKIDEFEITDKDVELTNMRMMFQPGMGNRIIKAGKFKRLSKNGQVIMSNTNAECNDHRYFVYKAKGNVLINGLGLGVVLSEVLNKDNIEKVTVIEKSEDVIKLTAPFFKDDPKVEIIHSDAITWKPPKGIKYNAVWHDIWDNICADNLEDMKKLHRKYGRKADWQGSWCRELCEMYK